MKTYFSVYAFLNNIYLCKYNEYRLNWINFIDYLYSLLFIIY